MGAGVRWLNDIWVPSGLPSDISHSIAIGMESESFNSERINSPILPPRGVSFGLASHDLLVTRHSR